MSKRILAIGVDIASDDVTEEDFSSRASLLDWDIVLFRPSIDDWVSHRDQYKGKPCLDDDTSFHVKEASEHWRREIKQAVESGKTVVVFLPPLTEVYIDTGNREYSGTGRNRAATRIVDLFSNYKSLPIDLKPINSNGTSLKLVDKGAEVLAPYWAEFSKYSEYRVLIQNPDHSPMLQTKNGARTAGVLVKSQASGGSLVCLPDLDFYRDSFFESTDDEKGTEWSPEGIQFAARLVTAMVALDAALRAEGEVTPEPAWAADSAYSLGSEHALRSQLLHIETELERVQHQKETIQQQLREAGLMRGLLYEKGKPLERTIIVALKVLGFDASPFREGASEFDVVFTSPEGRLIGEAEGKDSKAVNVDKLRQLAMNLHEDLQREEVTSPAKGVLFGNAFRLTPPTERSSDSFTEKCILAAKSNGTALIATSQLFYAAQYLTRTDAPEYAEACRTVLLNGIGVVSLPPPPENESSPPNDAQSDV